MEVQLRDKIQEIIKSGMLVSVTNSDDFYFKKAKEVLDEVMNYKFSEEEKKYLIENKNNYEILKEVFEKDSNFIAFGELIFTLISYCDSKAYRKNELNQYADKRVLALAFVRMNNWIEHLISYKFGGVLPEGSIKNAVEYLEDPEQNFTMLSENHRAQISENLFKKPYVKSEFKKNFLEFFTEIPIEIKNCQNHTYLLSRISYFIEAEWKKSIIGLLVGDGTGWQKDVVKSINDTNYITLWNHKKPNGTSKTLKLLRACIEENGHFKIFYSSNHNVNYVAEVIDFVTSQEQLDKVNWANKYQNINWYEDRIENYHDETRKAGIVYLASKFYPVVQIPENHFKYLSPYGYPSVGSQAPIVSYKSAEEMFKTKKMEIIKELLEYKKQIILQGPPGTGKTKEAKEFAKELTSKNNVNSRTIPVKHLTSNFIKSTLKVNQKLKSKNEKEFEIVSLEKNVVVIKSETSQPWRPSYNKIIDSFTNQLWLIKGRTGGFKSYEDAIAKYLYEKHLDDIENSEEKIEKIEDFSLLIQFHPSYTYEDFVRGIVAKPNNEGEGIIYQAENKTIAGFAEKAVNDPENNYVLIIDEINRANLSTVLGELIYALEYRGESVESMYDVDGSTKLNLPPNLYIIGTMNTADRSVGHIDYAIRRRFAFVDIQPKDLTSELGTDFETELFNEVSKLFTSHISKEFNIKDIQLGHSYFIHQYKKDKDGEDIKDKPYDFKLRLEYEIKPILLEYLKDGILIEKKEGELVTIINALDQYIS